ncbi:hypothetical protein GOP47_0008359 [Adiantum capillus-veneris]|uniref:TLC domain-containing protein n=1 Tax=Adiantum capillus-veneris TaxID=13818 RepID=A0A9D4UYE4_ADICA|nr:hypothetical protein GOP47_0008359 [Adiantum capillus-veneris]
MKSSCTKLGGGAHALLCLCCGFFAFDLLDLLRSGFHPSTLLHHGVLLACFNMALLCNVGINYLVLTLVCEIHLIFHTLEAHFKNGRSSTRWELASKGRMGLTLQDGSLLVRAEWGLHWMAFFITRLLLHMFITIKVVQDASKFSSGIEWPHALGRARSFECHACI